MNYRIICAALILLGGTALTRAATITNGPAIHITDSQINLSVYPGKVSYSGTVTNGTFGDGTAEAHALWRSSTTGVVKYASSTPDITTLISSGNTGSGGSSTYGMYWADVWTATDPGANFSTAPDLNGEEGVLSTVAGTTLTSLTIDVTEYLSGTLYVVAGCLDNPFTYTVEMTGTGQPTLSANIAIDPPFNRNMYSMPFSFTSDKIYETLTVTYSGGAGNRDRFMGIVLDAELPPGGTVLVIR